MSSRPHGIATSRTESTNYPGHVESLLLGYRELCVSYHDFPWFKAAPVGKVLKVVEPDKGRLYWPDLDAGLETIKNPEKFTLKVE